jgi:site-specific DNA recombinase
LRAGELTTVWVPDERHEAMRDLRIALLLADFRERGIVTKVRQLSDGRTVGGIPFTRGPLAFLLRNRFYIGEVVFRGQICPAEHPPVLDRELFEAVRLKLAEQHNGYRAARAGREALLVGRIFDDRGNRMSPSHSRKGGARYGYYVSSAVIQGQPQSTGSVTRVPAAKVEAVIVEAVRRHVGPDAPVDTTELITTYVRQIEVRRTEIVVSLLSEDRASEDETDNPLILTVPWSKTPHRRRRDVIAPENPLRTPVLPIRSDTRVKLVTAIARGHQRDRALRRQPPEIPPVLRMPGNLGERPRWLADEPVQIGPVSA